VRKPEHDAALARELERAETEMNRLFEGLAHDVGDLVLRMAGPDGKVPLERLPDLLRAVRPVVDSVFIGGRRAEPFDERNEPLAPFPVVIARGQRAMIDAALEEQVTLLNRYLPEDVRHALALRPVKVRR